MVAIDALDEGTTNVRAPSNAERSTGREVANCHVLNL